MRIKYYNYIRQLTSLQVQKLLPDIVLRNELIQTAFNNTVFQPCSVSLCYNKLV